MNSSNKFEIKGKPTDVMQNLNSNKATQQYEIWKK